MAEETFSGETVLPDDNLGLEIHEISRCLDQGRMLGDVATFRATFQCLDRHWYAHHGTMAHAARKPSWWAASFRFE